MHQARGFTLLEMLAVLMLLGVALGVMGYGLQRGLNAAAERKALAGMVHTLRAARVSAIVSGQPAQAHFDLFEHRVQTPSQPAVTWPANWQVQVQTAQGLGAAFEFYPDGGASGGNVLVRDGGKRWRIDVAWLTGAVQWQALP